jgi:hypothetical protein
MNEMTGTRNVGGRRYGDPMNVPTADELAESQADLNEYLAHMIMGEAFNERRYVDRALTALTNHNLAARFGAEFAGVGEGLLTLGVSGR